MSCFPCGRTFHEECIGEPLPNSECCCQQFNPNFVLKQIDENSEQPDEDYSDDDESASRRGRREANNRTLKDPQSTGRKRAAKLFPLNRAAPCEWAGLEFAGGGKHPIKGCGKPFRPDEEAGTQVNRHHGPDKSTTNNSEGNVHRICSRCHNRWHAANDPDYDHSAPQVSD